MRLMLQAQHGSQHVSRTGRVVGSVSSSSAGTASTKAMKHQKCCAAESSKSAAATSAAAAKTSETNAAASQQSAATSASAATTKASEAPPQPGMRRPQKRQRNHQKRTHHQAPVVPLPRQRRQEFREGGKNVETTPGLLKRQRDRAPRCGRLKNSGCVVCQCRVNKCRAGLSQCHRRRKIGRKCRIVCFNSHNEGWRSH